MNWLRLIAVQVVLLSVVSCFAAEPNAQNEQEKNVISRETAQTWIDVGLLQSKRGQYEQAEKSFLTAKEYQEYLTPAEQKQLEKNIADAHQGVIERQPILEHIKKAKELLSQGQPVKARAHYEKVRQSPYLTEQERKQIDQDLKNVDVNFDKQRKEMTDLYNRSVELYRAGEMEKARDGFVEVARYGMLVVPKGQTAEDYLIQIDSVLTEQLKSKQGINTSPPPAASQSMKEGPKPMKTTQPMPPGVEGALLKPGTDKTPAEKQPQASQTREEKAEVTSAAEPQPETPAVGEKEVATEDEGEPDKDTREKIAKTYTKAVVDDAAIKADYYISTGEFDKAIEKVRMATDVVRKNRSLIGDELFTQYSIRLKQLVDNIIHAKKSS